MTSLKKGEGYEDDTPGGAGSALAQRYARSERNRAWRAVYRRRASARALRA